MIVLASWNSVWITGRFNPRTGALRRRPLLFPRKASARFSGYFALERTITGGRLPVVVYSCGTFLRLHVGNSAWQLPDPSVSFAHATAEGGTQSTFSVIRGDAAAFQYSYRHRIRAAIAAVDPAYDPLDHEADHFLSFLASHAADPKWQAAMLSQWQATSPGA